MDKQLPFKIKKVYDNEKEAIRYSIYVEYKSGNEYVFICSTNPAHPTGLFTKEEPHPYGEVGEEINWEALPKEIQDFFESEAERFILEVYEGEESESY